MGLWAILPVKCYEETNSALSGNSFEAKLLLLSKLEQITLLVVMRPEPKAVSVARSCGARTISIVDLPVWETGLSRALHLAAAAGAARAMMLNPAFSPTDADFINTLLQL